MKKKIDRTPDLEKVFPAKKCAVCGKTFCRINYGCYAYKIGMNYFCGYKCMREAERNGIPKRTKRVGL